MTESLIRELKKSKLVAQCPLCNEEFKLSDALLFDGMMHKYPEPAEEKRMLLLQEFNESKIELEKRKKSAGDSEKKAIEVGFGKIIEKFIPAYKNLKLQFCECRPLYEPIDLIVFNGLMKGKVDLITFLEIKSGNASLNHHQKIIRNAVLNGDVGLKVL